MSQNLILVKGKNTIWQEIYQTPSAVTRKVLASADPTAAYKQWLLETRNGKFAEETKAHLEMIDGYIEDGYRWSQH